MSEDVRVIYAPLRGWLAMCARPPWWRRCWLFVTGRRWATGWDVSPVEQPLPGSHGDYSCLLERDA
jgi:hypothetical protein